jgi:hypothetical protein
VVRAVMTDSLPVHKHVVRDVDGASRERNPAFCKYVFAQGERV